MQFCEWAEQWIASPSSSPTRDTYRAALRHIRKTVGNATVRQVADDRNGAKRMLAEAPGTYAAIADVITGALNAAVDDGMIRSHSLTRMKIEISTRAKPWTATTPEQRQALADAMGPDYALAVWTAFYCGLRAGEWLGLRKPDFMEMIGPDGPMVVLRLTGSARPTPRGKVGNDTLKSRDEGNSEQWGASTAELAVMIKDAPVHGSNGELFPAGFNPTLYARVRKARVAAGLPGSFRLHHLRHEYVSDQLHQGISDSLVAQVVGRTSTVITHRIYGHQTTEGLAAILRARKAA